MSDRVWRRRVGALGCWTFKDRMVTGSERADLFSDLESVQLRQADIEQNQIRLQLHGVLGALPSQSMNQAYTPELGSYASNWIRDESIMRTH
jgi:hypothetical protein